MPPSQSEQSTQHSTSFPGGKAREIALLRATFRRVNLARFSRAFMPFLAVIAANIASSSREFFKLSPLGANVKQLGESGFAIYKSVIQRETSEIWASVLAGRAEAPVTGTDEAALPWPQGYS